MNDLPADLDLNLLRTLDVLLEHRSVTNAARALGRSQPAVSHALARLRNALGDPLLVREGSTLVPTPRALALQTPLRRTLADLGRVLTRGPEFDPATSTRRFVLACPDALAPLLPDLLHALSSAPLLQIEILTSRGASALERADLCLDVLPEDAPGVTARALGRTTQAVAVRSKHPVLSNEWCLESYVEWPHVVVRTGSATPSLVERALASVGRTRTVGLRVPNLLLAPHVVGRTDWMFTGARELLEPLAGPLGLALLPPPLPIPGALAAALWKDRDTSDPGHRWVRDRVIDVLKERFEGQ